MEGFIQKVFKEEEKYKVMIYKLLIFRSSQKVISSL